jgi:hypothetical protein
VSFHIDSGGPVGKFLAVQLLSAPYRRDAGGYGFDDSGFHVLLIARQAGKLVASSKN